MQSEQIINILHIGFIICLVLTILFAALSVFFFFQFKIRDVFNAITGRAQRKSVQQMEEENAKTGKLRQDYYSAPTSSDLYTTPSGRIPPVMSAQQADRQTARRTQNKFTIRQIRKEENIQCSFTQHSRQRLITEEVKRQHC